MSFGEPIALRGQAELEHPAAVADSAEARPVAETQFIDRLRAGDAAAFERLVAERSGDIYALLYRLTEDPEEARDLTQETFLQAFRSIAHFRGDADLRTWLYRIAVNQARNRWRWWRRRRRGSTVSLDATDETHELSLATRLVDEHAPDPEARTLSHEREEILLAAVRQLARPYREAVVLRDVEGLSYEEVAAALDISVGTVKSRLSRGRTELRRKLEGSL
ncbi:MAG: polymerase sigma-70 factor, subfamily [Pyrinomonadaceae bacterium]|nr:polymerase sigma-70 factor, subfamily [Pyrinomonadaceae bacterium]MDQ1591865.1 polymerase sigma-70 factor, subfamily [Pyrinomonadaceae bacterium]